MSKPASTLHPSTGVKRTKKSSDSGKQKKPRIEDMSEEQVLPLFENMS